MTSNDFMDNSFLFGRESLLSLLQSTVSHDQMKYLLQVHGKCPQRTLESVEESYDHFQTIGHRWLDKQFNNVIGSLLFIIPINQVKNNYANNYIHVQAKIYYVYTPIRLRSLLKLLSCI